MAESPRFTFGGSYTVEADALHELTGDVLEKLRLASREGRHKWVVAVVHVIDDPDQAFDEMELNEHNLIALTRIHCLTCARPYDSKIRFAHCDGDRDG